MNHHYSDIRDLIDREPTWWDEYAVPRYCEFAPRHLANIYASEAVLLLIECQACSAPFRVAMSMSHPNINWFKTKEDGPVVLWPKMAESIDALHYGDPPYGCCGVGATMNSIPRRVLEFWEGGAGDWKRRPELERGIACEWADEDAALASRDSDRSEEDR